MNDKLRAFEKLVSAAKRRPKSTENIFVNWSDVARGMGVTRWMVHKWRFYSGLPNRLPITRQFIENWRRRRRLTVRNDDARILRTLELRLIDGMDSRSISRRLHMGLDTLGIIWEEGLKRYPTFKAMSNRALPETAEEAQRLYQQWIKWRRSQRGRHEHKDTPGSGTTVDGYPQLPPRS